MKKSVIYANLCVDEHMTSTTNYIFRMDVAKVEAIPEFQFALHVLEFVRNNCAPYATWKGATDADTYGVTKCRKGLVLYDPGLSADMIDVCVSICKELGCNLSLVRYEESAGEYVSREVLS